MCGSRNPLQGNATQLEAESSEAHELWMVDVRLKELKASQHRPATPSQEIRSEQTGKFALLPSLGIKLYIYMYVCMYSIDDEFL